MVQNHAAGQATPNEMVNVKFGVHSQPAPFAGQTVAQIRQQLKGPWELPDDTTAYKGKEALADSYIIQPGDDITFHKRMGEKG